MTPEAAPPGFAESPLSTPANLAVAGTVGADPPAVWEAFVDPEALTAWWADEAVTEPVVGGRIEARWPRMGWKMRGRYTELDPGRAVSFTWSWDHEPDQPERSVRVTLAATDGGTHLSLSHGAYGPDDEDERSSHLAGWLHFLPRLAAALAP